ncbi:conserved hypothetical protein [Methanocella paludicola SANAE]|uniref:Uncharacterized protein n=1 Tax=Methanocella paludicola (strain DSM 17711 / JCM 13418 / NBRC 101707 / SANAE) TaxID=304371 RepID=D1Z152_METPS|nr:hypothetical protein [Methanocella paludicola]BAI62424.1 conserved hypothetical protein [Methanocella paludicola SANAE]
MSGGYSVFLKTATTIFVLTGLLLTLFIGQYSIRSEARADFCALSNRSTRNYLPQGANNNGSAIEKIVHYPGIRGVGNTGIGNGSLRTLVSDVNLDPSSFMLPKTYSAANVNMSGTSPSIVIGEPQKDIFNEFPIQPGTIYGKVMGLRLPGGNTMNMGIRSFGYGYYDPKIVGEKIAAVSKLLESIKNN